MCAQKGNWIGRKEEMRMKKWRRKDIGKGNFIFREFAASVLDCLGIKVFKPKRDFSSYSNIFFVRSFGLRSLKYILDGVIFDKSCFY